MLQFISFNSLMTIFRSKDYILFQSKLDSILIEIIELWVLKNECLPKLILWPAGFVVTLNSTDANFSPIPTSLLANTTRLEFFWCLDIATYHRFKSRTVEALNWRDLRSIGGSLDPLHKSENYATFPSRFANCRLFVKEQLSTLGSGQQSAFR